MRRRFGEQRRRSKRWQGWRLCAFYRALAWPDWAGAIAVARFSFDGPTGLTHGYRATFFVDVCHAYVLASVNGQLHHKQVPWPSTLRTCSLLWAALESRPSLQGDWQRSQSRRLSADRREPDAAGRRDSDGGRYRRATSGVAQRYGGAAARDARRTARRRVGASPAVVRRARDRRPWRARGSLSSPERRHCGIRRSPTSAARTGVVNAAVRKRIGHQGKWFCALRTSGQRSSTRCTTR